MSYTDGYNCESINFLGVITFISYDVCMYIRIYPGSHLLYELFSRKRQTNDAQQQEGSLLATVAPGNT